MFAHLLGKGSKLITVELERPFGSVFEEQPNTKRCVVAQLVPGSNADQQAKVC